MSSLVKDTRFLTEGALLAFIQSLVLTSESLEKAPLSERLLSLISGELLRRELVHLPSTRVINPTDSFLNDNLAVLNKINDAVLNCVTALPTCSASSGSWLEMVLAEAALRNRDRFIQIWPVVGKHYKNTLSASKTLNYITERLE